MISKENAIDKIKSLINRIDELKGIKRGSSQFNKWKRDTQVALEHIFGEGAQNPKDFQKINYSLSKIYNSKFEDEFQQSYVMGLENARYILVSMIEEIQEYWDESREREMAITNSAQGKDSVKLDQKKVFVVHGHDAGVKETIARFIEKLGLDPIILHEKPNKGRTIIEKVEDYSDVGFAVVLLTADDQGGPVTESKDELQFRARQNVVLELGYFIGKLGRSQVCALHAQGVEIPTDFSGVLYIKLDDGGAWKRQLARELNEAGLSVNINKAL